MQLLSIAKGKHTPFINFDLTNGILNIKGKSIPENAPEFTQPVIETITECSLALQTITTPNISLIFFNTSSSKYLIKVLTSFASHNNKGTNVLVNWHHDTDDEDRLETANDPKNSCEPDFKYIADEDNRNVNNLDLDDVSFHLRVRTHFGHKYYYYFFILFIQTITHSRLQ